MKNNSVIIRCAQGLAKTAIQELKAKKLILRNEKPKIVFQQNHDLILFSKGLLQPHKNQLRIPEEIHDCFAYGRYKISISQIDRIAKSLSNDKKYRVVIIADGKHFFKKSMKQWLEKQLKAKDVSFSENGTELWMFCIDEAYYISVRNSHWKEIKNRKLRTKERQGSLLPTIASAMSFLANPKENETIWDPTCGSGTILAEIGSLKKDLKLIGMDTDSRAVAIAKNNTKFLKNIEIIKKDSTHSNLEENSIDIIIANLPFGKQFGTKVNNERLYSDLFRESERVASNKCRCVFLTSDLDSMDYCLKKFKNFKLIKAVKIKIKGEHAQIFVINILS